MIITEEKKIAEEIDLSADFQKLLAQSKRIKLASIDYNISKVNTSVFNYNPYDDTVTLTDDSQVMDKVRISRYALTQLCNKVGVPMRYIDKCVEAKRFELVDYNINDWVNDYRKNLFVRTTDGTIRGILSDKYSVLDSDEILDITTGVLGDMKVKGSFLSPERLHLRTVFPQKLDIPNEDLFTGIQIDSSDVGRSVLSCKIFLYKQVCTNGLTVEINGGVLFNQRHISISADEFRNEFVENIKKIPSLTDEISQMVLRNQKRESFNLRNDDGMKYFFEYLKEKVNFTEEHSKKTADIALSKYGDSQWGVINSLTEVAQDFTLERRLEIEKFAGKLLAA